jgi:hypothetical protein
MVAYLLLSACVVSAPASETTHRSKYLEFPAVGGDMVPRPPQFTQGLPDPVELKLGTPAPAAGVLLPRPLDLATEDLLHYIAEEYPEVVAVALEQVRIAEGTKANGRLAVQAAQWRELAIQEAGKDALDNRWPTWAVAMATMAGASIGVVFGFWVGDFVRN